MDWIVPNILHFFIAPMLLYYYYGHLLGKPYKWYLGLLYTALAFGLSVCEAAGYLTGFINVLLQLSLLALCGIILMRRKATSAFSASALVISAYSIIEGIAQSVAYWIIGSIPIEAAIVLKYADIGRFFLSIILMIVIFRFIQKAFADGVTETHRFGPIIFVIPVLFIALTEKTLSAAVYGDEVIWDSAEGLIAPVVNNAELLVLRLFALAGLFCVLFAYQKLMASLRQEQAIRLLRQQTQNQETYVAEARLRYEQTRSFRHDVKNHLLVVKQLMNEGKQLEADSYLSDLEQVSDSLSYSVNTGNSVADVLLGSKLAVAVGRDIPVDCLIAIPSESGIKDIDWCIILSNALDNAIAASEMVSAEQRFIGISGRQKGNFYLLNVENRCTDKTAVPIDGTGLANIRAVAQKYSGKADIEIADCIFKLSVLLVISQQ